MAETSDPLDEADTARLRSFLGFYVRGAESISGLIEQVSGIVAARETKARADEREQIAQAIEALPGPEDVGISHWQNEDARHGYLLGIEEAAAVARIARSQS